MSYSEKEVKKDLELEEEEEDPLIRVIGQSGRWQLSLYTITSLSIVVHAWQTMANKFLTYPVDFVCSRPSNILSHLTVEEWLNVSSPLKNDGSFDRCKMFDMEYYPGVTRPTDNESMFPVRDCHHWDLDDSLFQDTSTQRWQLVCDRAYLSRLAQTAFFCGTFAGVFLSGILSDWLGRIVTYRAFLLVWVAATVGGSFVTDFWLWTVLRLVAGGSSIGYNTVQVVYVVEMAAINWRSATNAIFRCIPFGVGHVTLGLLAYLVPNAKTLQLVIGLSGLPFLLASLFMPESPRWLFVKGRSEEGMRVVKKACSINRIKQPDLEDEKRLTALREEKPGSHLQLLSLPGTRRNLLLFCTSWFAISMAYFGLAYNTPPFNWNIFLVFVFPAFFDLPISLALPYCENRFGRKLALTSTMVVTGVFLMLTLTSRVTWMVTVLAWAGQIACSTAFSVIYSYIREVFPTSHRSTALSLASSWARVGAALSPTVATLDQVDPSLPVLVYGAVILLAGVASVWLWPETRKHKLPDSLEECEVMASTRNGWLTCRRSKGFSPASIQ